MLIENCFYGIELNLLKTSFSVNRKRQSKVAERRIGISYPVVNPSNRRTTALRRKDIVMQRGYHNGQGLTTANLDLSLKRLRGQPLETFARERVGILLMVDLKEVAEFLGRCRYERGKGKMKVYHNGHRERRWLPLLATLR